MIKSQNYFNICIIFVTNPSLSVFFSSTLKWRNIWSKCPTDMVVRARHLQQTEVRLQAVSDENGVCGDELQQRLLDLLQWGAGSRHILLTDAWKPARAPQPVKATTISKQSEGRGTWCCSRWPRCRVWRRRRRRLGDQSRSRWLATAPGRGRCSTTKTRFTEVRVSKFDQMIHPGPSWGQEPSKDFPLPAHFLQLSHSHWLYK